MANSETSAAPDELDGGVGVPDPLGAVTAIGVQEGDGAPQGIYEHLRDLILSSELEPGTVLSQVALAKALGVSRTPLREAIRRLQQEGLVEAEHNRRARVASFDPGDLEAVYCNRLLLESLGIAVTAPRLDDEEIESIDSMLKRMEVCAGENDDAQYQVAHREFHRALVSYGSPALQRQITVYSERGLRYRNLYRVNVESAYQLSATEHLAIFDACREHDQLGAVSALARHLSHTALGLLGRMSPERDPVMLRTTLLLVIGQLEGARAGGRRRK